MVVVAASLCAYVAHRVHKGERLVDVLHLRTKAVNSAGGAHLLPVTEFNQKVSVAGRPRTVIVTTPYVTLDSPITPISAYSPDSKHTLREQRAKSFHIPFDSNTRRIDSAKDIFVRETPLAKGTDGLTPQNELARAMSTRTSHAPVSRYQVPNNIVSNRRHTTYDPRARLAVQTTMQRSASNAAAATRVRNKDYLISPVQAIAVETKEPLFSPSKPTVAKRKDYLISPIQTVLAAVDEDAVSPVRPAAKRPLSGKLSRNHSSVKVDDSLSGQSSIERPVSSIDSSSASERWSSATSEGEPAPRFFIEWSTDKGMRTPVVRTKTAGAGSSHANGYAQK